jgi:hypothetical protein
MHLVVADHGAEIERDCVSVVEPLAVNQ